jgi:hypothetical protein
MNGNRQQSAKLDAEIARCIDRLAAQQFEGPISRLRSGVVVRSWAVLPFRIYYERHSDEIVDPPRLPPNAATDHAIGKAGRAQPRRSVLSSRFWT